MEPGTDEKQRLIRYRREVLVLVGVSLARYQKIEHILKILTAQIELPGDQPSRAATLDMEAPLNAKNTLGMLAEEFRKSVQTNQPQELEDYLKTSVSHRNDLIHHFFQQPIGKLTDEEACGQAVEHLRLRYEYANGLLQALKGLGNHVVQAWEEAIPNMEADS